MLRNYWLQRLLIGVVLAAVFWNGLWGGVPRADQLPYLHQVSQYHDWWDIFLNSPSWNRTHAAGDALLFRPLLYWQLGTFYYLFGYDFFLWQAASLILHILVVVGVHSLLTRGRLRASPYPFLLSLLFGCSLLGSELVLWNHIAGYLMFSFFSVYLIYALVRYVESKRAYWACLGVFLGVLAEFTYELGFVLNMLVVVFFAYRWRLSGITEKTTGNTRQNYLMWAAVFLLAALLYPIASVIDLWVRAGFLNMPGSQSNTGHSLLLAAGYALAEIMYWVGGWIFSAVFDIHALDRASFRGLKLFEWGAFFNYAAIAVLLVAMKDGVISFARGVRQHGKLVRAAILPLMFLLAYSFVIAYGRALPSGLNYVFGRNIYYGYIADLSIVVGIALCALDGAAFADKDKGRGFLAGIQGAGRSRLFLFGVAMLVGLNAYGAFSLAWGYRYDYSPSRQEVLDSVAQWLAVSGNRPRQYFDLSNNCVGNEPLFWFGPEHIRKNSGWEPPVALADALWPEKSFRLNKKGLAGTNYTVSELRCTEIVPSSQSEGHGAPGLMSAGKPGWYAAQPVTYPQTLTVAFKSPRNIRRLAFLPPMEEVKGMPHSLNDFKTLLGLGTGKLATSAPEAIRIEVKNDGGDWRKVWEGALDCGLKPDQWRNVVFVSPVTAQHFRITVLSNCGDTTNLGLRSLKFDN